MQKIIKSLSILAGIVACATSYAQPKMNQVKLTGHNSVDSILRSADIHKLIQNDYALNLTAQTKDADTSTNRIEDLNDFVALGTTEDNVTIITEFDGNQAVLNQAIYAMPWLGVYRFQQNEIPDGLGTTLQEGLDKVTAFMAAHDDPVSGKIANVTIYKTILSQQIVYDYAFTDKNAPAGFCKQVLYLPPQKTSTGTSEAAFEDPHMDAPCHVNALITKLPNKL